MAVWGFGHAKKGQDPARHLNFLLGAHRLHFVDVDTLHTGCGRNYVPPIVTKRVRS